MIAVSRCVVHMHMTQMIPVLPYKRFIQTTAAVIVPNIKREGKDRRRQKQIDGFPLKCGKPIAIFQSDFNPGLSDSLFT